jgi:hypothetical protein
MPTRLKLSVALLCFAAAAWPQADANKGSISGTVIDPNQAVVPNAKVTVSSPETGLQRQAASNDAGQYRFGSLDPGVYEVKAEAPGFALTTMQGVVVGVGSSVTVNLAVALSATIQSVEVAAGLLQITDTSPSQLVGQEAIRDLPINGRRFQDFATMTPTVQANSDTRGQLSFVGQRGINSNVMVDGADYNEPFFGGIRGGERSIFAFTVPQSSVQEFQTVTAGYSAEYGRSTGGVLNAVTRSGSNSYHGDAFYQLRHKELGLKSPLNQQSLETQHQYGGGVGGPIKRDKLFFFGAFEQQRATFPHLVRFPTLDALAGSVTPDIAPAYDYFRSLEKPFAQTNNVLATLGRIDYQFTNGSRLTGRYNYSKNTAANAVSTGTSLTPETNSALSNNGTEGDNTHTAVGQLTSILSPALVNDVRGQYSREGRPRTANDLSPNVSASVIGLYGTRSFLPTTASDYRIQFADGLTWQHGRHTMKFGGDYNYISFGQSFGFNQYGAFNMTGSNVRTLLQIMSGTGSLAGKFDDPSVSYVRQIGNLQLAADTHQIAFFGQDSWRVSDRLTINYGLRWEGQVNPQPATNNDFLVNNVRDFTFPLGRVNPTVIKSQNNQFAPRLGFAWTPTGNGKTVVRAQTGLYYAQTPLIIYSGPLNNYRIPGGDVSLAINAVGTNTIYKQFLAAGIDLNKYTLDKLPVLTPDQVASIAGPGRNPFSGANTTTTSGDNYRNPRSFQATFGAEHQLPGGLVVDYQLNHVNTVHLERNIDYNVPFPIIRPGDASLRPFFGLRSGRKPNPNIGQVTVKDSGARSNYTGNTFRAQYRMKRVQFAASYTLSYNKSDDDNERTSGGSTYFNPFDFSREYNWSVLDARHQVGGYAVFRAPFGIELTTLFKYRSGTPLDATTGADTAELLSTFGNRPLEAPGVPFLRNAFRNLDYKTIDFRFLKSFPIRETVRVQFSCEMFNMFNFENITFNNVSSNPALIYGLGIGTDGQKLPVDARFLNSKTAAGAYNSAAVTQLGVPFQAQFGLRLIF